MKKLNKAINLFELNLAVLVIQVELGIQRMVVEVSAQLFWAGVGEIFQGLGCSPIKAARELGSERRETVRSLSVAGVGNLRGAVLSTRGPGWTYRWCTSCSAKGIAG